MWSRGKRLAQALPRVHIAGWEGQTPEGVTVAGWKHGKHNYSHFYWPHSCPEEITLSKTRGPKNTEQPAVPSILSAWLHNYCSACNPTQESQGQALPEPSCGSAGWQLGGDEVEVVQAGAAGSYPAWCRRWGQLASRRARISEGRGCYRWLHFWQTHLMFLSHLSLLTALLCFLFIVSLLFLCHAQASLSPAFVVKAKKFATRARYTFPLWEKPLFVETTQMFIEWRMER